MKLAVSNIAWMQHDDPSVLDLLTRNGVTGIEVAPTKVWSNWEGASHKNAVRYRALLDEYGFEIPAMQAILFGRPELQVFDTSSHYKFLEHIKLVADIANGFGSKVLVFGAPKNRKRGQLTYSKSMDVASEFFSRVAEICYQHGCCIGIENNPVEYGCDFVTNVFDAKELVQRVDHKGFQLHIDSAGIHMCGGDISAILLEAGHFVHYHISEPMLEPIIESKVNHALAIQTLNKLNYEDWVSVEMTPPLNSSDFVKSLEYVDKINV